MSNSIFEIEHRPGEEVVLRFKSPKFRLLPDSTRQHLRSARKEFLLALRDMLDKTIERAEEPGEKKRKTKIEVQ